MGSGKSCGLACGKPQYFTQKLLHRLRPQASVVGAVGHQESINHHYPTPITPWSYWVVALSDPTFYVIEYTSCLSWR